MDDIGTFKALGPDDLAWLDRMRVQLIRYIGTLLPHEESRHITAEMLDDLWVAWRSSNVADDKAVVSFVNAFGTGFGDLLTEAADFEWSILTDEYGTDYAVRAMPGTANTRVAPIDFVMKRLRAGENGKYVAHAVSEIVQILERHRAEWSASAAD